jgi:hypothetical protein
MSHLINMPRSYLKTALASAALVPTGLVVALLSLHRLPHMIALIIATLGVLVALVACMLVCAGIIVLVRYRRGVRGARDLFLELNKSREAEAIRAAPPRRVSGLRRWLGRHLLGHDLIVGDVVEIKSWDEIRATLDERGSLEQLPFMPEMLAMCGQRAHVYRCLHRLFDYRKSRKMRHMSDAVLLVGAVCNGASHGGCEAACHTIWKSEWLRRVEPGQRAAPTPAPSKPPGDTAVLNFGIRPPHYVCQLTQLHDASRAIKPWNAIDLLRPLIAGNVTPTAFVIAWLTYLFNLLQQLRHGVGFPMFETPAGADAPREDTQIEVGDRVVVRSSGQIRATLNDQLMHRGLWFEPDMLKYCGGRYRVQSEVRTLIDIVTGEIRTIKTPAYMLHDVRFSGERQLFNAQLEPLFWRGAWLQRDKD